MCGCQFLRIFDVADCTKDFLVVCIRGIKQKLERWILSNGQAQGGILRLVIFTRENWGPGECIGHQVHPNPSIAMSDRRDHSSELVLSPISAHL
eukprot:snap_masked-scaffold1115_size61649-processed-gene-0.2 protein:Tk09804 transcript:snap_masked-scaffold1115_size61649-processed-gene-0.2-mRNA-1 annotation:"nad dependent epimerase dehydratase"